MQPPTWGRLRDEQKSIQDNAVCAEVFTRLYHLTREEEYNEIARSTLESFAASVPQMGYFASAFAKQVDLFLHQPVEVNIVGEPSTTREMLWCALSLYVPFRSCSRWSHETPKAGRALAASEPISGGVRVRWNDVFGARDGPGQPHRNGAQDGQGSAGRPG